MRGRTDQLQRHHREKLVVQLSQPRVSIDALLRRQLCCIVGIVQIEQALVALRRHFASELHQVGGIAQPSLGSDELALPPGKTGSPRSAANWWGPMA